MNEVSKWKKIIFLEYLMIIAGTGLMALAINPYLMHQVW